jgi:serine/threonine protein kinase
MSKPPPEPCKAGSIVVAGTTFDLDSRYELIKAIGHGAYGVVISCTDTLTGNKVAVKKIPNPFDDIIDAKRVLREVKLLMHFKHDNLMSVVDIQRPKPTTLENFKDVYIVSPLMETDLHRIIYSRQALTDDHAQYFVYQLLRGLKYMHSAKVLHRDLKPSNVLLNSNCDLKICDFGLSRGTEETSDLTEYVVTRWYRAPEIMLSCQEYSCAVDIWSVGCIFAECLGRKPLFPGDDYIHQLQLIADKLGSPTEADMHFIKSEKARRFMKNLPVRDKIPWSQLYPKANPQALDLLDKLLIFDPAKRITVDQALRHEYLESLHCPEDEPSAESVFSFDFEKARMTVSSVREEVFRHMLSFHPAGNFHQAKKYKTEQGPVMAPPGSVMPEPDVWDRRDIWPRKGSGSAEPSPSDDASPDLSIIGKRLPKK